MRVLLRSSVVGLVVGLVLSHGAACGPGTRACNATNCGGCCNSTGRCESGTSDGACGASGTTCGACASKERCTANACIAPTICSLISQDCLPGNACIWGGSGDPRCTTTSGSRDAGETCSGTTECVRGTVCVTQSGAAQATCAAYCAPGGGGPACPSGTTCEKHTQPGDAGLCL